MDLQWINHEDFGLTVDEVNAVIDSNNAMTDEEWSAWHNTWWDEMGLPRGLQCVELHAHLNICKYVESLIESNEKLKAHPDSGTAQFKLRIALHIDSMIS